MSTYRLARYLAAWGQFCAYGARQSRPETWHFWVSKWQTFNAMKNRAPGQAFLLFRLLAGLENRHPRAMLALVAGDTGTRTWPTFHPPPDPTGGLIMEALIDGGENLVIHLEGEITDGFPVGKYVDAIRRAKHTNLYINSCGGDSMVADELSKSIDGRDVVATIVSKGFSAAAQVWGSARYRRICKSAFVMIHRSSQVASGNAEQLRSLADGLDLIDAKMLKVFRAACPNADVESWLRGNDRYFSAPEALACGLATEIIDDPPAPPPPPDTGPPPYVPAPPPDDADAIALTNELMDRLKSTYKDKSKFCETLRSFCQ